jgi:hypothetical protein
MFKSNNSIKSNTEFNNLFDIFAFLVASKFAIVIITFLFTAATSSYLIINKPQPIYKSSALIEIGEYFDNVEKQNKLIEASNALNTELNKIFINRYLYDNSKQSFISLIEQIQEGLIKLEARSSSIEQSEKSILEIIDYVINRHEDYFKNIKDQSNELSSLDRESLFNSLSDLKIEANYIKNIQIPSDVNKSVERIFELELIDELISESLKNNPDVTLNAKLKSNKDKIKTINLMQKVSLSESELNLKILQNQINLTEKRIERIDEDIRFMKSNSKFKNSRLAGQIITSIEPQLSSMLAIISSFIFGLLLSCFIILVANSIMTSKK